MALSESHTNLCACPSTSSSTAAAACLSNRSPVSLSACRSLLSPTPVSTSMSNSSSTLSAASSPCCSAVSSPASTYSALPSNSMPPSPTSIASANDHLMQSSPNNHEDIESERTPESVASPSESLSLPLPFSILLTPPCSSESQPVQVASNPQSSASPTLPADLSNLNPAARQMIAEEESEFTRKQMLRFSDSKRLQDTLIHAATPSSSERAASNEIKWFKPKRLMEREKEKQQDDTSNDGEENHMAAFRIIRSDAEPQHDSRANLGLSTSCVTVSPPPSSTASSALSVSGSAFMSLSLSSSSSSASGSSAPIRSHFFPNMSMSHTGHLLPPSAHADPVSGNTMGGFSRGESFWVGSEEDRQKAFLERKKEEDRKRREAALANGDSDSEVSSAYAGGEDFDWSDVIDAVIVVSEIEAEKVKKFHEKFQKKYRKAESSTKQETKRSLLAAALVEAIDSDEEEKDSEENAQHTQRVEPVNAFASNVTAEISASTVSTATHAQAVDSLSKDYRPNPDSFHSDESRH